MGEPLSEKDAVGAPSLLRAVIGIPAFLARALIKLYRYTLSSIAGRTCRHLPTCSEYADIAIARFGLWGGGWMAFARFSRCRPFGTHGFDPVPESLPSSARWFLPWRYGKWRGPVDNRREMPDTDG
jgi:putative membrane protein insertion efficiency factor